MKARLNYAKAAPGVYDAMAGLERYLHNCGLEKTLLVLVKLRASQINGCAYCMDMHWKDLRAAGETEQRLYSLDAWRECPYYTDRERPRLAWTRRSPSSPRAMPPTPPTKRPPALQRKGAVRPDARGGGYQRLEPPVHRRPHRPRRLPAREGRMSSNPERAALLDRIRQLERAARPLEPGATRRRGCATRWSARPSDSCGRSTPSRLTRRPTDKGIGPARRADLASTASRSKP